MSERLKNTLSFVNLAAGANVVLPHGLNTGNTGPRSLAPDIIYIPSPDLEVTASDEVAVTLRNQGPVPLSGSILVEAWHTLERAFNGQQNTNLPVKPYVVVSVENNGAPPWPPLVPLGTEMRIYARATGSDVTGNGRSIATAYRTLQRAVRDIPQIIPPNLRVTVDVTDLGTEVTPDDFTIPPLVAAGSIDLDFAGEFFFFRGALNIQADPMLVPMTPTTAATLAAPGDFTVSTDPNSGRITLTLTGAPRPNWAANALKGRLYVGAGGSFECGRIVASGAMFITLARTDGKPGSSGVPTTPIRIMRESAELTPVNDTGAFRGGITLANQSTVTLGGLVLKEPSAALGFYPGLEVVYCGDAVTQLCTVYGFDVQGGSYMRNQGAWFPVSSYGGAFADNTFLGFRYALVEDPLFVASTGGELFLVESTMLTGVEYSARAWPGGQASSTLCHLSNCDGGGAFPFAFSFGGGQASIRFSNLDNYVNEAILIDEGAGFIDLINVVGSGNGIGVVADNNNQVRTNAVTNNPVTGLRGTAGADFKVGSLAPAAWPGIVFNTVDPTTLTRIYGV